MTQNIIKHDSYNSSLSKRALGCKWIYCIKYKVDGTVERYKSHLVVLENTQKEGIDLSETFVPVAKMEIVRTLLVVASACNWPIYQIDVYNVFLHGDLFKEVYMRPPPSFRTTSPLQVCRLKKIIIWSSLDTMVLIFRVYHCSSYLQILSVLCRLFFVHLTSTGVFLCVLIYVNDILITRNSEHSIGKFKDYLGTCFCMKDLGPLQYVFGHRSSSQF